MRYLWLGAALATTFSLAGCKKDEAKPAPRVTSIKLVSATPAAGSRISASTTLNAQVDYSLADSEQSEYGYTVFMQFKNGSNSTGPGTGSSGNVIVTERSGRIDLSTALASYWNRIEHPVTCYLYLGRKTSTSGTTTLERVELKFTE